MTLQYSTVPATCRVTRTQNKPIILNHHHGLFPKLCIICQKENLFCKNSNLTYSKAKLVKCESNSQSLLKADKSACDKMIEQTSNKEAKSGMIQCKLFDIFLFIDVGRILSFGMIGELPCAVLSIDILPGI